LILLLHNDKYRDKISFVEKHVSLRNGHVRHMWKNVHGKRTKGVFLCSIHKIVKQI